MPRLKLIEMDSFNKMTYFRKDDKLIAFDADVAIGLISDSLDGNNVGVVRCKDCKWYEIEQLKRDGTDDKRYKPSVCVIGAYAKPRKADWYCADGERREDAETN